MSKKFLQVILLALLNCGHSQVFAQQACKEDETKPKPKSAGMPQEGAYTQSCHWCELSEPNKGTTSLTCCCAQPNGTYQTNHQDWPTGNIPKACENNWGNLVCSK